MTMSSVAADIAAADISYPSGDTQVGSLKLSVSTRTTYDTVDLLKEIPLTSADGSTIYLEDVADVYTAQEENDGIARYNGNVQSRFLLPSSRVKQQFLFPMQ